MRPPGPPRRTRLRRFLAEKLVWPLLDVRDFVLRRKHRPPLYAVHHVARRVRFRWAVLDAWDKLWAPFARVRRLARARPAVPAAALGALLLAAAAAVC